MTFYLPPKCKACHSHLFMNTQKQKPQGNTAISLSQVSHNSQFSDKIIDVSHCFIVAFSKACYNLVILRPPFKIQLRIWEHRKKKKSASSQRCIGGEDLSALGKSHQQDLMLSGQYAFYSFLHTHTWFFAIIVTHLHNCLPKQFNQGSRQQKQ